MADGVQYAVEMHGITKTFGKKVIANKNVDLFLKKGEILALLGENGSGKTTLMNQLTGIYFPDSGYICVNGKEVQIRSPRDAFDNRIGMIHQHYMLVDVFSAAENIILGTKGEARLDRKAVNAQVSEIADKYGFELDPKKKIYDMAVSEKQTVEIVKALYRGADILVLDEPTAVLTPQEVDRLFEVLKNMKADGKSIIIITHKLNEVLAISDRVTVLRQGMLVGTVNTCDATAESLTEMMVGHSISLNLNRPEVERSGEILRVEDITVRNDEGIKVLDSVSFSCYGGEILGIAGIAGSGQKELCETIAGLVMPEKGRILFSKDGKARPLNLTTGEGVPGDGIGYFGSLGFVPEDRLGMGLVASMGMTDNVLLRTYRQDHSLFTDRNTPRDMAKELISSLDIKTPGVEYPVRRLSGGNVQKVLLGREILVNPSLLIVAYPTRGLDIMSSFKVYDLVNEQKKKGVAVLYIGEDLDVLLELCDRILVLCGGMVSGIVDARTASKNEIGLYMIHNGGPESGEVTA